MKAKTPRCSTHKCSKPARVHAWCNTHAMRELDKRARAIVMERDKVCRAASPFDWNVCRGPLQWAHVHSRRYHAIRHDPRNAVVLCAGHHAYYTHRPLEWEQWCRENGIPWDELRTEALTREWSLWEALDASS